VNRSTFNSATGAVPIQYVNNGASSQLVSVQTPQLPTISTVTLPTQPLNTNEAPQVQNKHTHFNSIDTQSFGLLNAAS